MLDLHGISRAAFDLVVASEVTSHAVYERKYPRVLEHPSEESGPTGAIGYDFGRKAACRSPPIGATRATRPCCAFCSALPASGAMRQPAIAGRRAARSITRGTWRSMSSRTTICRGISPFSSATVQARRSSVRTARACCPRSSITGEKLDLMKEQAIEQAGEIKSLRQLSTMQQQLLADRETRVRALERGALAPVVRQ